MRKPEAPSAIRHEGGPTPALIVGGGPVGMMLAMNLARLGVRSVIVNSDTRPRWHPKGSTHNSRTMEHYRRLGIAARIRRLGLPSDYPTDVGFFTRFTTWELARIAMPSEQEKAAGIARAPVTDQTPEPIFRCNQMYVERFLFDHLCDLSLVDVRFGWECVNWAEHDDAVLAVIEERQTGRRVELPCSFLIGCDGGQSGTRRKLGIHYTGEGPQNTAAYLDGPMVATHLRVPDFYARVTAPRCWQYRAVNPEAITNSVALDGLGEFTVNSRLASADEKPDDRKILHAFQTSVGAELKVEIISHSRWIAGRALVAESYGTKRVHLAGDAVHLFTPAGGFGMNTGIDDVANLAWKLAARIEGWGGPQLLETYEHERRPIGFRNTRAAKNLGRWLSNVPMGPSIEEDSAAGAEARRASGEYLSQFRPEFESQGIQLGARYDASPIIVPDGTDPPRDDPDVYVPTACPGGRAPHAWMPDRTSLFDHFGRGFTLLSLREAPEATKAIDIAQKRGLPLKLLPVMEREIRELYGRDFSLIRPDQHVAWRGDKLPDDFNALLARVTGWGNT